VRPRRAFPLAGKLLSTGGHASGECLAPGYFRDALRAFVANLDGVESNIWGSEIGRTPSSYDFAVVGSFTTQSEFERYRDHPDHQRIISDQIAPILGDRTVVQLMS
jgi:hypothetical protein